MTSKQTTRQTIYEVPNGHVFLGKPPFSKDGERFMKMHDLDGDSWVVCLDDWICCSIPEDCLELQVEVIGKCSVT